MPDPTLSRRTLLATSAAAGLAGALPTTASAAARWRLLPETITSPPRPAFRSIPATSTGTLVAGGPDGIPLLPMKDGRNVIHPTQLGNLLNAHLEAYQVDGNRGHLTFVGNVTNALMRRAGTRQGASYLAYEFDWHAQYGALPGPWYSSFGQAKFPRVCWWMYKFTGERVWLDHLQRILAAFRLPPVASRPNDPWIAGVDSNNCLWLEEYPYPGKTFSTVFNGHYFALAELAFYEKLSGDPLAHDLVQGAGATLDYYRLNCRVPDNPSMYYAQGTTMHPSYHAVNTLVYTGMFTMTGAPRFAKLVDLMVRDWPVTGGAATLRVENTAQQIMKYGTNRPGTVQTWQPGKVLSLPSSTRARWIGFAGVWSYMNDGPYRGWFIREQAGRAYRLGTATDLVTFGRQREVLFSAKVPITGYAANADGTRKAVRTTSLAWPSKAHATQRALVWGQQHIRILDGVFAGLWVPESNVVRFA